MRTLYRVILAILLAGMSSCSLLGGTPTPYMDGSQQVVVPTATPLGFATAIPLPSATLVSPVTTPSPPSPTPISQQITLEDPANGNVVGNPVNVQGRVTLMPFEATLVIRIYDARGQVAAVKAVTVQPDANGTGTFTAQVTYGGITGAGRIEVVDMSAEDGSVIAGTSAAVTLTGFPSGGYIEVPAPQARVTLPLRLLARGGQPGGNVNITITWDDGTQFVQLGEVLQGRDGRGLVITTLDWVSESRPAHPRTQRATLQVHSSTGHPLAWQEFTVLHPDDPGTMGVNVYWVKNGEVVTHPIRIPRTLGMGRATLDTLLWGPVPGNLEGFTSAVPTPKEILSYPNRGANWGERTRLGNLTIIEGVARADLSPEILAYNGGATQVLLIREQIEQSLLQFSTVNTVIITVDGQPDMLEP
ncbi:MAG: GerMN domain-containing protein [Anaerolineae bacterium]|nr:GerMN domain-containing protein [Anaerolineae bacterium]